MLIPLSFSRALKPPLQTSNRCRLSSSKMEEPKAAAYYNELTRPGEGADRFKQGLGFSSASKDFENPLHAVQRCLIRRHPSSASSSRPLSQKREEPESKSVTWGLEKGAKESELIAEREGFGEKQGNMGKERNGDADFSKLIQGYDKMSAAERVKAKMKLQQAETADRDTMKGMGSGWERFEFNKDGPRDDGEVEG